MVMNSTSDLILAFDHYYMQFSGYPASYPSEYKLTQLFRTSIFIETGSITDLKEGVIMRILWKFDTCFFLINFDICILVQKFETKLSRFTYNYASKIGLRIIISCTK